MTHLLDQSFRPIDVGLHRVGHLFEHAARQRVRQKDARIDRPGVEYQCLLEKLGCLRNIFATRSFVESCPPAKDVIHGVGIIG